MNPSTNSQLVTHVPIRATFALVLPPECHMSISYLRTPQSTELTFCIRDTHMLGLTPIHRAVVSFTLVSQAHLAPENITLVGESAMARLSTQAGEVYSIDKTELPRLKAFLQQVPGIRLLYTANVLGHLLKDGSNKQHEFITPF